MGEIWSGVTVMRNLIEVMGIFIGNYGNLKILNYWVVLSYFMLFVQGV